MVIRYSLRVPGRDQRPVGDLDPPDPLDARHPDPAGHHEPQRRAVVGRQLARRSSRRRAARRRAPCRSEQRPAHVAVVDAVGHAPSRRAPSGITSTARRRTPARIERPRRARTPRQRATADRAELRRASRGAGSPCWLAKNGAAVARALDETRSARDGSGQVREATRAGGTDAAAAPEVACRPHAARATDARSIAAALAAQLQADPRRPGRCARSGRQWLDDRRGGLAAPTRTHGARSSTAAVRLQRIAALVP